jgi:hypothetical protein
MLKIIFFKKNYFNTFTSQKHFEKRYDNIKQTLTWSIHDKKNIRKTCGRTYFDNLDFYIKYLFEY